MTSTVLVLKRAAKIKNQDDKSTGVEYLGHEILFDGPASVLLIKLLPHLNGKKNLEEIASQIAVPLETLKKFSDQLCEAGIFAIKSEAPGLDNFSSMSGVEFHALHHKYVAFWLESVYSHPLWEKMITGKATRSQILGFAFEKYHYIEGAHEHMGVAAANATPEMQSHLARHFIEEYTHGDIYRRGLNSLFCDEHILHSQPLPSTRALVNFLSETAARNSFSYYAGNEVLQMTENTHDRSANEAINGFYGALREHYPYTLKLIDSFIAHTHADQTLGHSDVFLEMCQNVPALNRKEVVDAMCVSKSMVEHLNLFLDGIDIWYGRDEIVPRMPCDLLSE